MIFYEEEIRTLHDSFVCSFIQQTFTQAILPSFQHRCDYALFLFLLVFYYSSPDESLSGIPGVWRFSDQDGRQALCRGPVSSEGLSPKRRAFAPPAPAASRVLTSPALLPSEPQLVSGGLTSWLAYFILNKETNSINHNFLLIWSC